MVRANARSSFLKTIHCLFKDNSDIFNDSFYSNQMLKFVSAGDTKYRIFKSMLRTGILLIMITQFWYHQNRFFCDLKHFSRTKAYVNIAVYYGVV